jgi:hypothetical protein
MAAEGRDNQINVDVGFGDGFGDLNSDFENPILLHNRSNVMDDNLTIQMNQAGHARNSSLMDQNLNSHR